MNSDALARPARPVPAVSGGGGGCPCPRHPAAPQLLRCSRRRGPSAPDSGSGTAAVARRNERERNRVKLVNLGFQALREHVPFGGASRKLSKVETLRSAVEYIRALQLQLAEADSVRAALAAGRLLTPPAARTPGGPVAASSPSRCSSSPGSPGSDYLSDDSTCRGALSPEERELLDLCWLGGY